MSPSPMDDDVGIIKLTLHDRLVGHLTGSRSGRNVLSFAEEFKQDLDRPTLSVITRPNFPAVKKLLAQPWVSKQKLHPTLSNLLPEGALRELIARGLKVHVDREFEIIGYLGQDLPGALVATPMAPNDVPDSVLRMHGRPNAIEVMSTDREGQFSLAGVQMKFSGREEDGRYNLKSGGELGDWIIKTPSTRHKHVPLNEYTAMTLASLAGVQIPEIKLVELQKLDALPPINLPDEKHALAIKRFDRDEGKRIHMEDFAQVLVKYPHEKYGTANYEQIAKVLYEYSADGLDAVQQFARRLLANILLANGDAHLKNWSLLYEDKYTPTLSPAYDILTTSVYIEDETKFALKLGKTNAWFETTTATFQAWAKRADIPWRAIRPHLDDVMERARSLWPAALKDLPMNAAHKKMLTAHWGRLQPEFRL